MPFTFHGRGLNLFASRPSIIRVITNERERVLSFTLPEIAGYVWNPTNVLKGLPSDWPASPPTSTDLWKYLALAAALCLIAEWWFFGRRRRTTWRQIPLVLKVCGLAAILVALVPAALNNARQQNGGCVARGYLEKHNRPGSGSRFGIGVGYLRTAGTNWLRMVPFSSHARSLEHDEIAHGVHLVPASNRSGDTTNFEAAISDSLSAMPSGFIPRIVLMSDGNDNEGSTARAIAGLQQLQFPVDTIPLTGRSTGGLRLTSVSMPKTAYAGEQIPIDLHLEAPAAMEANVSLSAEGKELGTSNVSLQAGSNDIRVHARVKTVGATAISGEVNQTESSNRP